jgi:metal-responsive CopG/Arc/MetJ family transcriptional regulator
MIYLGGKSPMSVMTKRILVNLPAKLYRNLKILAKMEYKSVSGIIRESIVDKLNSEFSPNEMNIIEKGRSEYREGKGVKWRSIKRG